VTVQGHQSNLPPMARTFGPIRSGCRWAGAAMRCPRTNQPLAIMAVPPTHRPVAATLLLSTLLYSNAWGPEGGYPGTLDLAHNRKQPPALRSWQMNLSTACFFVGNDTSANSPAESLAESRFGAVGIGWQLRAISSNFSHLEQWEEEAARELKARRPGIHAVSRPTGSSASQPQRGTARRSRRTLAPCYLTSTVMIRVCAACNPQL
jgi:hypothetical protein